MRILLWSELFWPYMGGSQVFAIDLIEGLQKCGHKFIVVTRQDDLDLPKEAEFRGIPVYRFPFYSALVNGNIEQLIKIRQQVVNLKRTFAPDLVHINGFGLSILFHLDTAHAYPAPLLVTLHGERYEPVKKYNTLLEQTLRSADWVSAPSDRTIEYARQLVPDFVPPSSRIYNGVEMPRLRPERLPFNPPQVLCLGRLVPNKGFDLALKAFASITQRFPQVRLVIAGDGPERPVLQRQAAELGLEGVVGFLGWIDPEKVPALINAATLVVVPSRGWEALPFVALEAALMARPVVAARDGGLPEIVVHRETGLIVEKEDSGALAEAISFLLEHSEAARKMGHAARRRVREFFTLESCIDAYDALYRRLSNKLPDAASV